MRRSTSGEELEPGINAGSWIALTHRGGSEPPGSFPVNYSVFGQDAHNAAQG
ncbi:MAG: hypothetical protein GXP11_04825 [Gammaproteobacteria bacterium]|nr:hypothetical protein [Gammaproteobacteria bacterium]